MASTVMVQQGEGDGDHPDYLESFLWRQFYLLQMDRRLPLNNHHCFIILEWLNGLQNAPQWLRNLNDINKFLTHRHWHITKDHIQELGKTGEQLVLSKASPCNVVAGPFPCPRELHIQQ
ncbi:hypothetical protein AAFF_G00395630 [Aldrovandia affinis]|uniref:Uncharacterized protein n=1 Tax=Aldrovandia affinis TaxID=143900 RepID=A0AAD7WLG8_9TELE|nr:hypothetical protein AAFF_G00395630 [Aldrovandia affinis]